MQRDGEKVRPSPREAQVAALICEGLDNYQIAEILRIAEQTVKHYRCALYEGLAVHNATELLLWCMQNPTALGTGEWASIVRHARGCPCGSAYCSMMRQVRSQVTLDRVA